MRVFTWHLKEINGKNLFRCFIYVFVSIGCICVIFNELCCSKQLCGLLLRIHLKITAQSRQTSPNESVLHLEVVFVVCWYQIRKLVQVDFFTVALILFRVHQFSSQVRILITLKQIFQLESKPCVYLHDSLKRLVAKVSFDASFICLSRLVAFRRHF